MIDPATVHDAAQFVTDFADQALLLPLAAGIALLFATLRWWRGAVVWTLAIGTTLTLMGVLKLVAIACGSCWFGPSFTSPSGHVAAGTAVYGGLVLAGMRQRSVPLVLPLLGTAAIAAIIAATRLELQVHSWPEVVVGGLVGMGGAIAFMAGAGPFPGGRFRRVSVWCLLILCAVAAIGLHGIHLPAEASIRRTAFDLLPFCKQCRTAPVPG